MSPLTTSPNAPSPYTPSLLTSGIGTSGIGRELDRLVVGFQAVALPRWRATMAELGDPLPEFLAPVTGHLAEVFLEGRWRSELTRLRHRYLYDFIVDGSNEKLANEPWLDADWRPVGLFREALLGNLRTRAELAAETWGTSGFDVTRDGSAKSFYAATSPLCALYQPGPLPQDPAQELHHLLTYARYVRTDAHAAAWEDVGLTGFDMVALEESEAGRDLTVDPMSLIERGWLDAHSAMTVEGIAGRAAIEDRTNELHSVALEAVEDQAAFLDALRSLATPEGP